MEIRAVGDHRYADVRQQRRQHTFHTDPGAAWTEARQDGSPVLAVLSAPEWCYWCRVHESERSLFDPAVWSRITEEYVPLLIDTGQHPELFTLLGAGGWPTTAAFGPEGRLRGRFTGPRQPGRFIDWLEELPGNGDRIQHSPPADPFSERFERRMDDTYGGFGTAGKRPGPELLLYALDAGHRSFVERTVEMLTTDGLDRYRLTDPVEGGVHRYAEARDWTGTHYEKLVDDTAGLIAVLERLGRDTDPYRGFLERMRLDDGGFAASEGPGSLGERFRSRERDGRPYRDERPLPYRNARTAAFLAEAAVVSGDRGYTEMATAAAEGVVGQEHGIMAAAWLEQARRWLASDVSVQAPDPEPLEPYGFDVQDIEKSFGPELSVLGRGDDVMSGDLSRDVLLARDRPADLS